MTADERLRIAIIGAGIGGLSLSAALGSMGNKRDMEIDIYEASSHISEIGAGINFWPRTWNLFKAMGLAERLLELLPQPPPPEDSTCLSFEVRKGDQPEGFHIENLTTKGGSVKFHRADLQQALMSSMNGRLHLSHRFVSYEERDQEIYLKFENGTTAICDLLVGMDGLKSAVRPCFLMNQGFLNSPSLNPIWSGDTVYRALIPIENLNAEFPGHRAITTPTVYIGKSKNLITYPVSHDKLVNFAAVTGDLSKEGGAYDGPAGISVPQEEVFSVLRGWDEEVQALIRCIHKPTKWPILVLQPMDRYSRGRVILAGDAAHAMTPYQGAGAGQAVQDAYVLASLISDKFCTRDTLPRISEIYNTIRCPMGNLALEKSRTAGRLSQFLVPELEDIVEGDAQVPLERLLGVTQKMNDLMEWVWKESAIVEKERALAMLRNLEAV